jgi:hypothetical protein
VHVVLNAEGLWGTGRALEGLLKVDRSGRMGRKVKGVEGVFATPLI